MELLLTWIPANHFLLIYLLWKIQMPKGESGWLAGVRCLPSGQWRTRHLEWLSHKDYTCWANHSFLKKNGNAVTKRRRKGCWAGKNNRCPLQQVCLAYLWWAKRPETMQRHRQCVHMRTRARMCAHTRTYAHTHTLCQFPEKVHLRFNWLGFLLILLLLFKNCLPLSNLIPFCPVSHITFLPKLWYFQ